MYAAFRYKNLKTNLNKKYNLYLIMKLIVTTKDDVRYKVDRPHHIFFDFGQDSNFSSKNDYGFVLWQDQQFPVVFGLNYPKFQISEE